MSNYMLLAFIEFLQSSVRKLCLSVQIWMETVRLVLRHPFLTWKSSFQFWNSLHTIINQMNGWILYEIYRIVCFLALLSISLSFLSVSPIYYHLSLSQKMSASIGTLQILACSPDSAEMLTFSVASLRGLCFHPCPLVGFHVSRSTPNLPQGTS